MIPKPVSVTSDPDAAFSLDARTRIVVAGKSDAGNAAGADGVAQQLAAMLRPATGFSLDVASGDADASDAIVLSLDAANPDLDTEGYQLTVTPSQIEIQAHDPAGLFHGVQTLRQLLPAAIEGKQRAGGPWTVPGGRILDYPRYAWRGAMLDVARHFLDVETVERYIDDIARYKINTLHLHLSDDQGWRIQIDSWPKLTEVGGKTHVSGGSGGYFTKDDYRRIVQYAAQRFITIVPEIDTPGHTNAALNAYPELTCDGVAPAPYTGTNVGFSSLCIGKPVIKKFLNDVVGELAAMTPGPYIHLGGDEAHSTDDADYIAYIDMAQQVVRAHGKQMVGWAEIYKASLQPGTLSQYWDIHDKGATLKGSVADGVKIIASPADRAYLDQKYDASTKLGTSWAGPVSVRQSYQWDPAEMGAPAASIIGVEAPLWTETIVNLSGAEFMAFPRLAGIAEIGWSPKDGRTWDDYAERLAAQGPRWKAAGINFYASPQVPWPKN